MGTEGTGRRPAGTLAVGRDWVLTLPFVASGSSYRRVLERPSDGRWGHGALEYGLAGWTREDAEYWVRVLVAMPYPLQARFFEPAAVAARAAFFTVERANAAQGPAFPQARAFFYSEIARLGALDPDRARRRHAAWVRRRALRDGFRLLDASTQGT